MEKRFSLSSLRRILQATYLSICLVLGLVLVIIIWRGNDLYKERKDLYTLRSLKYHSSELRNSINSSFMRLQSYAQYDTIMHAEEIYYHTAIDIFYDETLSHFDTVQRLADGNIESVLDIKKSINELESKFGYLRKKTERGQPLRNYIRLDMLGLVMSINKNIEKLIMDEENREQVKLAQMNEKISKNNYLAVPLFIFIMVFVYVVGRRAVRRILDGLKRIYLYLKELAQGQIPSNIRIAQDEFAMSLMHIQTIADGLEEIKDFAKEVGNQNFEKELTVFPIDSELGEALDDMKKQLSHVSTDEKERSWENEGVTEVALVIRKNTENIQVLCDEFLHSLIEYTQTQQGAIFLPTEGGKKLFLRSAYAYGRKKYVLQEILSDEGVLGEVFQDGNIIFMNDIPEDYAHINTGLGSSKPSCVLVVPLLAQEAILGVLEIASFDELSEAKIRLIKRAAANLAASISSVENTEKMKALLEESNEITLQMSAQEEELRQNTEELMATREQLEKQLTETQHQVAEKDHIFEDSNQGFIFIDASGIINRANHAFAFLIGYPLEEMLGNPISKYIPALKGLNRHAQRDSEQNVFHEYVALTRSKKEVNLLANVSKLQLDNQIIFLVGIAGMTPSSAEKQENKPAIQGAN